MGKTAAALELVGEHFEIISADSVQVYRYMDVGSGKPTAAERSLVRHHLIDVVYPDEHFTAGDFCREAEKASSQIASRGKVPLVTGGTGLYIDSYFGGLSDIPDISVDVRREIRAELLEKGLTALYEKLMQVDPQFASHLHPNDTQRILRGLEVYRGTGRPLSSYHGRKRRYGRGRVLFIGLYEERDELRRRIERRVDRMMKDGLVEEVRWLRERGYGPECKSMRSIGYAEMNRYLDGAIDLEEAVQAIKTATVQYAKRQLTWFRRNRSFAWYRPHQVQEMREYLLRWLDESSGQAG